MLGFNATGSNQLQLIHFHPLRHKLSSLQILKNKQKSQPKTVRSPVFYHGGIYVPPWARILKKEYQSVYLILCPINLLWCTASLQLCCSNSSDHTNNIFRVLVWSQQISLVIPAKTSRAIHWTKPFSPGCIPDNRKQLLPTAHPTMTLLNVCLWMPRWGEGYHSRPIYLASVVTGYWIRWVYGLKQQGMYYALILFIKFISPPSSQWKNKCCETISNAWRLLFFVQREWEWGGGRENIITQLYNTITSTTWWVSPCGQE